MTIFYASGAALSALLVFWVLLRFQNKRRRLRLPPGPTGIPFFGNSFDIPKTYEWITYKRWSREFGEFIYEAALTVTSVQHLSPTKIPTSFILISWGLLWWFSTPWRMLVSCLSNDLLYIRIGKHIVPADEQFQCLIYVCTNKQVLWSTSCELPAFFLSPGID